MSKSIKNKYNQLVNVFGILVVVIGAQIPCLADIPFSRVQEILTKSCGTSGCHSAADFSYASLEKGLQGVDNKQVILNRSLVVPTFPERSLLYKIAARDSLLAPLAAHPTFAQQLSSSEKDTIKRWIQAGCKDENNNLMFQENLLKERFVITNQNEDLLTVIEPETGREVSSMSLAVAYFPAFAPPRGPHFVNAYTYPEGIVTLIKEGVVQKVNFKTQKVLSEIVLGGSPAHVEFTPDGKRAIVTNYSLYNRLHIINWNNFTLEKSIEGIESEPHALALSSDGKTAFVGAHGTDKLYVIDIETGNREIYTLYSRDTTGGHGGTVKSAMPYQIRYSKINGNLYITCANTDEVRVWSPTERKVIDSIPVGKEPLLSAWSADGQELWIANRSSNSVSVISIANNSIETISGLPNQPHGIICSSDGKYVGVTCENLTGQLQRESVGGYVGARKLPCGYVAVIDARTRKVRSVTQTASFAGGIDVLPNETQTSVLDQNIEKTTSYTDNVGFFTMYFQSDNKLTIYPNFAEECTIDIVSLTGSILNTRSNIQGVQEFDVRNFSKGCYGVRVYIPKLQTIQTKLVILQ